MDADQAMPQSAPTQNLPLLRQPVFRQLWLAQIVSIFGDSVALFAITTVAAFDLRVSPQAVTGLQFFYLLPLCTLGMVSGSLVDFMEPRKVMIGSDFARCALCLCLLDVHGIWGFNFLLVLISSFSCLFVPAQTVLLRRSVSEGSLRSASSLNQQVIMLMRIVGPIVAATLLLRLGPKSCYLIDALSFFLSAIFISCIPPVSSPASRPVPTTGSRDGRVDGLLFRGLSCIRATSSLFLPVAMQVVCMFVVGCFAPLMAVYIRDVLHLRQQLFGMASAGVGVGMLIATVLINSRYRATDELVLARGGILLLGIATAGIACFPKAACLVVGCCLVGGGSAFVLIPTQTRIQRQSPFALLGSVSSTTMALAFGGQLLGLSLGGVASHEFGVRAMFGVCAVLLFILIFLSSSSVER